MEKKMTARMWLALLVLYVAWGSTYLAIRYAVESLPPFFMTGTRFLVAGLVVYAWRRLAGDPAPGRRQWRSAAIIGFFMLVGGIGGVSWAEQSVASGITVLIVAAVPLWIVLVDALRPGGKHPSWQTAGGLLVGMTGILILAEPALGSGGEGGNHLASVIVLLLATLSWAIGSVYSRGADLPKSPLLGAGMEMLAGSAGLYIIGLLSREAGRLDLAAVSTSIQSIQGQHDARDRGYRINLSRAHHRQQFVRRVQLHDEVFSIVQVRRGHRTRAARQEKVRPRRAAIGV